MADKITQTSNGGQYAAAVAAGASGAAVVLAGNGRLCKVIVMTSGSAATDIYDNTAASGTKVLTIPANPTVGAIYDVQLPVTTGIFPAGTTNTSALTITYDKGGPNGV